MNGRSSFHGLMLIAAAAVGVSPAEAVSPKKVRLSEGVTITPTIGLEVAYDDNIFEAGQSVETGWVTSVSPGITLEATQGSASYQLGYSFNTEFYDVPGQDNDTDHHLLGSANIGLNRSNRIGFNGSFDRVENVSNTTVVGENDKFETTRLQVVYGLGVPAGRMSLDLGINQEQFRTFNSGGLNAEREYDKPGATAILYYRLAPKTRALIEYRYDDYDYELDSSLFDSSQNTYVVGLTWNATARTVGTIKVGNQKRNFDEAVYEDTDETHWTADLTWEPTPRDTVSFNTSKGIEDGNIEVTENVVDATRYGFNWDHQFTTRFYSSLSFDYGEEDYLGTLGRSDDVSGFAASMGLDLYRWLTVGVGYSYKERDSNLPLRDYDRNVFMLKMDMSL